MYKISILAIALSAIFSSCTSQRSSEEISLKDAFNDKFLFGSAINADQVSGIDSLGRNLAIEHFNTIVAENAMKSEKINPEKGVYNWEPADEFVKFGEENGMFIVGHCLVWHSQLAPWFPLDDDGNYVCADTLKQRMKDHIQTMLTRYKGRVKGWDVVNEAIMDDGSYRESPFYQILGEEYIPLAFQYAYEADPDAELYINDYGMDHSARRDKYVKIINDLKKRGIRIDAIGMQGHMGMDYPEFDEFEKSIKEFAATGCNVMVTEWDMSALPTISQSANISDIIEYSDIVNPYPNGLPSEIADEWNSRMKMALDMFIRNSDVITRVNAWGIDDGSHWKNDYPMPGRIDYPALFDRNYKMKPFLKDYLKNNINLN